MLTSVLIWAQELLISLSENSTGLQKMFRFFQPFFCLLHADSQSQALETRVGQRKGGFSNRTRPTSPLALTQRLKAGA